ncbi:putative thioredoxin, partial [Blyttiomyces helicus]
VTALNFWASWAAPCADMNEVFEELSRKFPTLQFLKIEAEAFPDVSEEYEIAAVPTFLVVKNGTITDRIEGANAPLLASTIEKHAKSISSSSASHSASSAPQADPKVALRKRLEDLVKSEHVMLFMKGTPQAPRCGFSRQTVELLGEAGVKYGSFNILADEEVRAGLKEMSDWPTYPQIYVNGELIGGLDILKEMIASGEFKKIAPPEDDINARLKSL